MINKRKKYSVMYASVKKIIVTVIRLFINNIKYVIKIRYQNSNATSREYRVKQLGGKINVSSQTLLTIC